MVTRVAPTLTNTNAPLAKWAAEQVGKKIAIISDTTDYGIANVKSFDKFFREKPAARSWRPKRRRSEQRTFARC